VSQSAAVPNTEQMGLQQPFNKLSETMVCCIGCQPFLPSPARQSYTYYCTVAYKLSPDDSAECLLMRANVG